MKPGRGLQHLSAVSSQVLGSGWRGGRGRGGRDALPDTLQKAQIRRRLKEPLAQTPPSSPAPERGTKSPPSPRQSLKTVPASGPAPYLANAEHYGTCSSTTFHIGSGSGLGNYKAQEPVGRPGADPPAVGVRARGAGRCGLWVLKCGCWRPSPGPVSGARGSWTKLGVARWRQQARCIRALGAAFAKLLWLCGSAVKGSSRRGMGTRPRSQGGSAR